VGTMSAGSTQVLGRWLPMPSTELMFHKRVMFGIRCMQASCCEVLFDYGVLQTVCQHGHGSPSDRPVPSASPSHGAFSMDSARISVLRSRTTSVGYSMFWSWHHADDRKAFRHTRGSNYECNPRGFPRSPRLREGNRRRPTRSS